MKSLEDKLKSLNEDELRFIFKHAEDRLNETLVTYNDHKSRLSEIIKFSIPVLGALLWYLKELSAKAGNSPVERCLLVIVVIVTLVILFWSVALYLPQDISVKGKRPSDVLDGYEKSKHQHLMLINAIKQYENSIKHNADFNSRRAKKLKYLTRFILYFALLSTSIYVFALVN